MSRKPSTTVRRTRTLAALATIGALMLACGGATTVPETEGMGASPRLPPPDKTLLPIVNVAPAVGWPAGTQPRAAAGLEVTAFATGLEHPRWLCVLPNGDVLVAESNKPASPQGQQRKGGVRGWFTGLMMKRAGASAPSADRITLLRDANGDGVAEQRSVFLAQLHSPYGMALAGQSLFVANADALVRFDYRPGATRIEGAGTRFAELPAGLNHHWTKNVLPSRDGAKLYVTVGSNSNVGENGLQAEEGRAAIWEFDTRTGQGRLFASGLRNPNGLGWEPATGRLWTVVNERDEIGNDLVPDYLTSVEDGAFYGWPWSYYGNHVDARVKPPRPDMVAKARVPDFALGSHVAPLGLAFADGRGMGREYARGVFVGEHGSWNRRPRSGYKVVFVPFENGKPSGMPRDVLAGFLDADGRARGRPVGVALDGKGALLVADDVGNTVWRVAPRRSPK